jgi:hypothetical protein
MTVHGRSVVRFQANAGGSHQAGAAEKIFVFTPIASLGEWRFAASQVSAKRQKAQGRPEGRPCARVKYEKT